MPFSATAIATNTSTSGATVAVTVPAAGVPPGSLIIVAVTEKSTGGTNGSVADSASNTWNTSQATNLAATAADGRGMVFFAFASKALANGNTITYTKATSGTTAAISAWYFGGVRTDANPEVTATRASATGTTGTITVTSAAGSQGSVFVGVLLDSGSSTAGAGATFTQAASWLPSGGFEANSGTGAAGNARVDGGYLVASGSGTQTYAPTLSSTAQQWALLITAFTLVPNVQQRLGVTGQYSDYIPDTIWVGKPIQNMTIRTPQALSPVQAPFYAPRPHTDTDYWQPYSTSDNTLRLLTEQIIYGAGGQVPTKQWHYDYDSGATNYWQGTPVADYALLNITPTHRFWRYDIVPQPDWVWTAPPSDTIRLSTEGGQPPTKFWRYDLVPDPVWTWTAPPSDTLRELTQATPFEKLWRYDVEQPANWLYPLARNNSTLTTTAQIVQSETGELYPDGNFYVWQYSFNINTSLYPPPPVVSTNVVQSPFYAPRGTDPTVWTWSGPPQPLTFTLLQLYFPLPPEEYYYEASADVWRFYPVQNPNLFPPTPPTPFFKLWRYDVNTDTFWTWAAPPSDTLRELTQATPFHKLWRYDLVPDPVWQGSPVQSNIDNIPAAGNPKNKQIWRYDYNSGETYWQGSPIQTNIETIPPIKEPTSIKTFWRYDYHIEQPLWLWSPPGSAAITINQFVLGRGPRRPLFLQGLNNFQASYWPNGQTTTVVPGTNIPANAYVTEDGTTLYVAEDGTIYIQEN